MAKAYGIYKCQICGNTVEMLDAKEPNVVCCGEVMKLMEEKTQDQGQEKHVPVVEVTEGKVKVKIGEVPHPMEDTHYIQLVEILRDGKVIAGKWLGPNDEPAAEFCIADNSDVSARIYCNIHGTWKN